MRSLLVAIASSAMLSLAACGGQGDDSLGDDAAAAAEAQSENLEALAANTSGAQAEQLEDQAEAVEENGARREEAIDDSDVDAGELSDAQKNALVNGR